MELKRGREGGREGGATSKESEGKERREDKRELWRGVCVEGSAVYIPPRPLRPLSPYSSNLIRVTFMRVYYY